MYSNVCSSTVCNNQGMEDYSAIENNEMLPFAATWMDLEVIMLCAVSQTQTISVWCHAHVESKKQHKWAYLQNRNRLTVIESKLTVTKGESGEG